jgi:hypothetical protein
MIRTSILPGSTALQKEGSAIMYGSGLKDFFFRASDG